MLDPFFLLARICFQFFSFQIRPAVGQLVSQSVSKSGWIGLISLDWTAIALPANLADASHSD